MSMYNWACAEGRSPYGAWNLNSKVLPCNAFRHSSTGLHVMAWRNCRSMRRVQRIGIASRRSPSLRIIVVALRWHDRLSERCCRRGRITACDDLCHRWVVCHPRYHAICGAFNVVTHRRERTDETSLLGTSPRTVVVPQASKLHCVRAGKMLT